MKIAMLISGGVDSSVAMKLLRDAGHDIRAFYLKIWLEDEVAFLGQCPWEDDLQYVRAVCEQLDVPLEIVSFQKEYWQRVVSYVLDETRAGRTPNPDMLCNARVKFGVFYEYISTQKNFDFEKIATGHYAQTKVIHSKTKLFRSVDPVKDQTYFLSQLSQEQVSRAMFPIGSYKKEEVRKIAQEAGLANADRKDSQGICFLGKVRFDAFLEHYLGKKEGDIIDIRTKEKIGEHEGFWYFTIGQRRGIHLSGGPWFVVKKDSKTNTIFVSNAWRGAEGARDLFVLRNPNWIAGVPPKRRDFIAKLRHGESFVSCRIRKLRETENDWRVRIANPDAGIAEGQFAVLYDDKMCLGGGSMSFLR